GGALMRILHVNKFLYPRGGAEAYLLAVSALQGERGHDIAYFGMAHPQNRPSRFEEHFPERVELNPPPASVPGKLKAAARLLYSPSARRGMEAVVEEFEPDVVHLHNIYHQLSPSVLRPLKKRSVPTIMTLHDYKLACPTYLFLHQGKPCEACLGGRFHHAALKRCNNGSLAASALNALELSMHTFGGAYDPIHVFACPSRFLAAKMAAAGVYPDRLRRIPHFIDCSGIPLKAEPGGGVTYAGRLSHEKGLDVLIRAVGRLGVPLDVAGEGPERPAFEALAQELPASVRFHGRLGKEELYGLVASSCVTVLASRWYENQPMAVLESFACGVPVIGTELGGVPELIDPGVDGALVPPNDPEALAEALAGFLSDPGAALGMGRAGRRKVEQHFSPQRHLERLEELYAEAAAAARMA
ncbi:MAG: glycosyltransferase family 4 protein, partial [Actinomycetota bacterium]